MAAIDIPLWSIVLAIVLRLYLTVVAWSFPIAAVLTARHWHGENRRRRGFLVWAVIAGLPWAAQPVFWIIGIAGNGSGWLLGSGG